LSLCYSTPAVAAWTFDQQQTQHATPQGTGIGTAGNGTGARGTSHEVVVQVSGNGTDENSQKWFPGKPGFECLYDGFCCRPGRFVIFHDGFEINYLTTKIIKENIKSH
jgi:hypothetical protein